MRLAGAGAGLGVAACGPSYQAVYESDVHFEHCYALDESGASVDSKKECWRDWLHGYTYGQSRDRVEYGGTRYSQLSLDPTLPSEDVPRAEAPKHAAPAPANAFVPPPNVSEARLTGNAAQQTARAPGAECADGCAQQWTTCRATCKGVTCDGCDHTYHGCASACFREDAALAGGAHPAER
ncbi:MAG TPA: hypothetical protein VH044_00045 [Polyangiaceae bacterium]|jgi:hypothetical protein|nr:hypothetical protein [Polyangiaceae bacterium]